MSELPTTASSTTVFRGCAIATLAPCGHVAGFLVLYSRLLYGTSVASSRVQTLCVIDVISSKEIANSAAGGEER